MEPLVGDVLRNDPVAIEAQLARGTDPNVRDSDGRTALIHAAIDGKSEIAKLLLKYGAQVDVQDKTGYSALHYAAQNYFPAVLAVLIEHGAKIDAEDIHGNTPLGRAAFNSNGRGEVISLLLRAGADRNHLNKYGQTPFNLAKMIANYDVAQFFE